MVRIFKKKIKKIFDKIVSFTKENLNRLLVILGVFIFLELIKTFPYINIIPNIDFLIIGATLLLAVFLFGVAIPSRGIIPVILFLLFIAMVVSVLELADIADVIGFVIFTLLSIVVIRQVILERRELKKLDVPKK